MSSPRSLFEIQASNMDILLEDKVEEQVQVIAIEETVPVVKAEIPKQEISDAKCGCNKDNSCACKQDDNCFHYWYFAIAFIALITIFIINYMGNRCHNYDWFNKHVNKEECAKWIAYGETINLFWSIVILILAFATIRLCGQSRGQERNILMVLYVLVLVLTIVQVYVTFEARNFKTGFLIGILLVILAIIFAWYSYRTDGTATVLIFVFILFAVYATAVDSQLCE